MRIYYLIDKENLGKENQDIITFKARGFYEAQDMAKQILHQEKKDGKYIIISSTDIERRRTFEKSKIESK